MTRRAAVSLTALFLLAGGCESGADPFGEPSESFNVVYDLAGLGSANSYGTLRITSDGDAADMCWDLTVEGLPKAVQLHQDITGPTDPVLESLYEPPSDPIAKGCRSLDQETATDMRQDPEGFYVDGHNSDRDPTPVIWAALTPPSEDD
jgi:hypothetical protein